VIFFLLFGGTSMRIFMLFIMLFCHVVDDFYLQGPLAGMKQAEWWTQKIKDMTHDDFNEIMRLEHLYRYDYVASLIVHSFSWTFMIQVVPLSTMIFTKHMHVIPYIIMFVVNMIIHILVDNFKANHLTINLVIDQTVHFVQVILTWLVFFVFMNICVV